MPVAIPMLAVGVLVHHSTIFCGSIVASLCPFLVNGIFLFGTSGKTCQPSCAYDSACSSTGVTYSDR